MSDNIYNVCYAGLLVSEMGYLLSFVYINAWVSQFFIDQPQGIMMAKSLSEQIAALSMFVGIIMGVVIGSRIDGKDKKILPYCIALFFFRGVGLVTMTTIVTDFSSQKVLLVACFIAMTSGTFCQTIVCQSLLNKRLVAPIKEIMNGAGQAFRAMGVLMVTGLGGIVSSVDVNAPFLMVGLFDLAIGLSIVILCSRNQLKE